MSIPPAGTSPASAYDIIAHAVQEQPPAILADRIDPLTGEFESLVSGRGLADAMVIEAVRVQRGTGASVREEGNRFREVGYVDTTNAEVVESMTREALRPAEEAGVLRLVSVTVEPDAEDGSQLDTVIEYRDLLAPEKSQTRRLVIPR
jgi:hypothetical protein